MIGEKYYLIEKIGSGGFGEVYLAVDVRIGRQWAVKCLRGESAASLREAQVMKELDYPTIPSVVDLYETDEGCCLVMDYIDGDTLQERLESGYTFTKEEIWEIGIQLAGTIQYLHEQTPPIFYRDLKPDNVMILADGQIRLIDFGIASYEYEEAGRQGAFAGTRRYAAPEQFDGTLDARTDIYGIGRILMALNQEKHFRAVKKIVRKCCRTDKNRRYQSAEALKYAMLRICEAHGQQRHYARKLAAVCGVLVLALLTAGIVEGAEELRYHELLQVVAEDETAGSAQQLERIETAIHLRPDREEGYLQLLKVGETRELTQEGIARVIRLRSLYEDETADHTRTAAGIAYLYFRGNADDPAFLPDYEQARVWFAKTRLPQNQEVQMQKLSEVLTQFSDEICWPKVAETLETLERMNRADGRNYEEIYAGLLACAEVWITDAVYLQTDGTEPYQKGIDIYEKLLAGLQTQEITEHTEIKRELLERLSAACALEGMLVQEADERVRELKKACRYSEELLKIQTSAGIRLRVLLRMASCYDLLEDAKQCVAYYEQALREYPKNIESYTIYAGYLLEQQEWEQAREILARASLLPESRKSQNYQILKERVEEVL